MYSIKVVSRCLIAGFLGGSTVIGDEMGLSPCGKPVIIRGEISHAKKAPEMKIAGTKDPKRYEEEVYGKEFSVVVEGLPEGQYTVEIYLAETYHNAPGKRVFSIYSGDQVIAEDMDIFAQAGRAKEMMLSVEIDHKEDQIMGPLELRFVTKTDHAKLNAVMVKKDGKKPVACVKAMDFEIYYSGPAMKIPEVNEPVVYTDSSVSVGRRVDDLVRRMSLYEKVNQLMNAAPEIKRLGVPAYDYWNECLHGVARAGNATVFPQAIAMAAMWDEAMMQSIADVIATEGRAKNNGARAKNPNTARYYGLTFWTPNINIFRDPRWGRGHETYGEDPYLTGRLAVGFIKGIQGDDPHYYKALACAKHFAVHSGPEKLRHTFNVDPSERDLYETYLPQFEMAVKEGKVGNIMSVYNAVYGVPGPASKFLLTDILRGKWGFEGHVVSDCWAVRDVWAHHKYVATKAEAAAISVLAGNDLNCGSDYIGLMDAVDRGLIEEEDIDRALKRVLEARFRLGLFDPPEACEYLRIPESENNKQEHSQLALEAARKSMVLLKNEGMLPLDKNSLDRIAVIGPNADSKVVLRANYHGYASNPITILQGIKNEIGSSAEVVSAEGCPLALMEGESYSVSGEEGAAAIDLAKQSCVVIFVGGLDAEIEGEEMGRSVVGSDRGDRVTIELPSPQHDLLRALQKTGTPVIYVNMTGSAMAMPWEAENLSAILQAWYPGQNGGTAVADVLFGNHNPAGRLPVTFYRATTDLPDFLDYSMANRTYRYFTGKPLYPFGHGLSYTRFEYGELSPSATSMDRDGSVSLQLDIKNAGDMDGDEVVQLFVRHLSSPVAQPLQSLAGFRRVPLKAGETKTVEFSLPASALRYWDEAADAYVIPDGDFEVRAGSSSADIRQILKLIVTKEY